jgi:hypothetical protein
MYDAETAIGQIIHVYNDLCLKKSRNEEGNQEGRIERKVKDKGKGVP